MRLTALPLAPTPGSYTWTGRWAAARRAATSTLCKLDVLGEAAHQFTCHAKLIVTGSKRPRVDVLGRKTRCRFDQ
jgi:hypothetical protein